MRIAWNSFSPAIMSFRRSAYRRPRGNRRLFPGRVNPRLEEREAPQTARGCVSASEGLSFRRSAHPKPFLITRACARLRNLPAAAGGLSACGDPESQSPHRRTLRGSSGELCPLRLKLGDDPVADAPVLGTPHAVWPPSPRRRTLRFPSGEFIRSRGRTARYSNGSAIGIIAPGVEARTECRRCRSSSNHGGCEAGRGARMLRAVSIDIPKAARQGSRPTRPLHPHEHTR